jgi:hypothetical protein
METKWCADETKRCFGMVPVVGYSFQTGYKLASIISLLLPSLISPLLSSCEVATRITLAVADDKQTAATILLYLSFFDLLSHTTFWL